jgi:hypothetical protein
LVLSTVLISYMTWYYIIFVFVFGTVSACLRHLTLLIIFYSSVILFLLQSFPFEGQQIMLRDNCSWMLKDILRTFLRKELHTALLVCRPCYYVSLEKDNHVRRFLYVVPVIIALFILNRRFLCECSIRWNFCNECNPCASVLSLMLMEAAVQKMNHWSSNSEENVPLAVLVWWQLNTGNNIYFSCT